LIVVAVAAGCSSSAGPVDEVGATCKVGPGAVCRDQNLQSVSLVAADLRGADFSGSKLTSADFTEADLRGAKFVGSDLSGTTFAGADLRDADLSKASLYYTNFTDADIEGINRTGMFDCFSVQPDGSVGTCPTAAGAPTTSSTGTTMTAAPVISYFRLEPPGKCVYDAEGTGIDIEWSVQNATSVVFSIDDIRVDSQTKPRGSTRLPFVCNGKPHVATMQAFGPIAPAATATITKSLKETAPQPPVG
jgi:hypothetical protein